MRRFIVFDFVAHESASARACAAFDTLSEAQKYCLTTKHQYGGLDEYFSILDAETLEEVPTA